MILSPKVKHGFLPLISCFRLPACSDALTSCECGPSSSRTGVDESVEDVLNIQRLICIIIQWNVTCISTQNRATAI